MQQNLKFPTQCTVIPAEELEQVSGGAPACVPPPLLRQRSSSILMPTAVSVPLLRSAPMPTAS